MFCVCGIYTAEQRKRDNKRFVSEKKLKKMNNPPCSTRCRWAARQREDAMFYILDRLLYYSCGTALYRRPTVAPCRARPGEMLKQ